MVECCSSYCLVVLIVILALAWYFRKYLKALRSKLFAWFMNTRLSRKWDARIASEKNELFSHLQQHHEELGRGLFVLEIGAGASANTDFYPQDTEIVCLDPNPNYVGYQVTNTAGKKNVRLRETVTGFAETMEFEDNTFDAVVSTFVMCTVKDPEKALQQIKRVLKPDGIFLFMEHVAAEHGTFYHRIQCLIDPILTRVMGGGHIHRPSGTYIKDAGFSEVTMTKFEGHFTWSFAKPCIMGCAVK